ncbi:MAG TPA: OmpA family protein [Saprospiraceae bacterium]|nr:OmpA family protein [Saprospiraceae bacterium]
MLRKNIIYVIVLLSFAVGNAQDVEIIQINNGSFEDTPRSGGEKNVDIKGWYDCGVLRFSNETAPDIHPGGFWKNEIKASDGRTYLGLVVRDNDSYEGVAQRLSSPLVSGKCYSMSVNLAKSPQYLSRSRLTSQEQNYTRPAVLRIWGGTGFCNDRELLAESPPVDNNQWQQYDFTFKPRSDYRYILVEAYYKVPVILPYNGHLLVDKLSDIKLIPCPDQDQTIASNASKTNALPPHKRNRVEEAVNKSTTVQTPKVSEKETTTAPPKKKILEDLDIKKLKTGSTVEIKNLYFKADSTGITKESYEVLDEIVQFLQQNKNVSLEIGGHTNGIPPASYCDKLSEERAKSVYNYLTQKGVGMSTLTYKGYGKRKRIANDATADGRRKNQRVELKVISL